MFSALCTKLSKEKAAIVINCPTLQNHFKVNTLGQLISFFDLFRFQAFSALCTKLTKEKAAIVINCPTLQNHFKVNALGQLISFFDLFSFQAFNARCTKLSKEKAAIVFFFFCILIIFIDYQFYIQFTTLTYYLLHSLTHTYIQAHTHPNDKSTKILKL